MDIFSHGLWAGAGAAFVNRSRIAARRKFRMQTGWTAFWGMFPDLFAFAISFMALITLELLGLPMAHVPRPEDFEPAGDPRLLFGNGNFNASEFLFSRLPAFLYHISHSAIIFLAVFGLFWVIRRRPALELSGWFLHILLDIPTHSSAFYPTPFLWPVSVFKVSGIPWSTPWFLVLNYFSLVLVYFWLLRGRKRKGGNSR